MSYVKKSWKDRQSEYPNRRKLLPVAGVDNVYEVAREEGLISEEGNPFDQINMNNLETRVESAFAEVAAGTLKAGAAGTADTATAVAWGGVTGKPATYPATAHTHDDRYYTESETNNLLGGKLNTSASCNKNWNWSGQGGQPSWLWGGNDATNEYLYNPSNFSVNYANSAGSAVDQTARNAANAAMPAGGGTFSGNAVAVNWNRADSCLRNIYVNGVSTNYILMVRK